MSITPLAEWLRGARARPLSQRGLVRLLAQTRGAQVGVPTGGTLGGHGSSKLHPTSRVASACHKTTERSYEEDADTNRAGGPRDVRGRRMRQQSRERGTWRRCSRRGL